MADKFQPNFEVIRLYDEKAPPPHVTKVGILPFLPAAGELPWRVMAMKPRGDAKHLGAPSFQLAKGTRRLFINERWCDMREDDLRYADPSFWEPLIDTALREGREEIGLKPSNIARLYDMGGFTFISATRNIKKPLHMFAAHIRDEGDFSAFERTTQEARWLTLTELSTLGRSDHVAIIGDVLARLMAALLKPVE
jgi:hypothetical protein